MRCIKESGVDYNYVVDKYCSYYYYSDLVSVIE
jgi:hypothetical protein